MGGSGGGAFVDRTPDELRNLVRKAEEQTAGAAFEAELASTLGGLLGDYNARDAETARERLDEVKAALQEFDRGKLRSVVRGVSGEAHICGRAERYRFARADKRQWVTR